MQTAGTVMFGCKGHCMQRKLTKARVMQHKVVCGDRIACSDSSEVDDQQ